MNVYNIRHTNVHFIKINNLYKCLSRCVSQVRCCCCFFACTASLNTHETSSGKLDEYWLIVNIITIRQLTNAHTNT